MFRRQVQHFVKGSLLISGLAVILTALCAGNAAATVYVDTTNTSNYYSYFHVSPDLDNPVWTGSGAIDTGFIGTNSYIQIVKEGGAGSAYYKKSNIALQPDLNDSTWYKIRGKFEFRVNSYYWNMSTHVDKTSYPLPAVTAVALDTLHILKNGTTGNGITISLGRPGTVVGGAYTNKLKITTSSGAELLSRNAYNFRTSGWHTVWYYIDRRERTLGGYQIRMRLTIDGNEEGLFSWVEDEEDTFDIETWDTALYGFGATYTTDIDYKMQNVKLEDADGENDFKLPVMGTGESDEEAASWYQVGDLQLSDSNGGGAMIIYPEFGQYMGDWLGNWVMAEKESGGTAYFRLGLSNIPSDPYFLKVTSNVLSSSDIWLYYDGQAYSPHWSGGAYTVNGYTAETMFKLACVAGGKYIKVSAMWPAQADAYGVLHNRLKVECAGGSSFITSRYYQLWGDPSDLWDPLYPLEHMPDTAPGIRLTTYVDSLPNGRIQLEVKEFGTANSPENWMVAGCLSKQDTKMSTTFNKACWGIEQNPGNGEDTWEVWAFDTMEADVLSTDSLLE